MAETLPIDVERVLTMESVQAHQHIMNESKGATFRAATTCCGTWR